MAEVAQGPDLETIATEAIGFLSIAGEAKLRATSSWADAPPAQHASLLSIASRRGLVAAAGPDAIVIANTQTVRKAFEASPEEDSGMRNLQPELRLPMQMRVSLLAFSADENLLMLSAESGGGLAVYDVGSLLQGSTQSAFELGTNGESLRALAPNPTREKAELCAVLTEGGNLHMANLRERSLGAVLRSQVSSISWSTRGKQLVAGLADGTIAQMTPEGEVKAMIPRPPCVQGDYHVSSIVWLENNLFLVIHTSTALDPPESIYNIITRTPPTSFSYQRLGDPVDPYGSSKPVHHSIARLKDWAPDLSDLLLVTSTASQDLGMLSRAKQPLDPEKPPETITNVFTTTEMVDDSKRAVIPMTETMDDSITIGATLDLSGKDNVHKPITGHEMEESTGPLPAFWLLTHEGVLCVWWVVYADAVKQGVTYQGMAVVEEQQQQQPPSTNAPPPPALAFGAPSSFGAPSTAAPAFGGASALGSRASPWASGAAAAPAPAFGSGSFGGATPAFGQPSQPAFGQSMGLGSKASPWASAAAGGSTFGSAAGSGGGTQGVFGAQSAAASGGFASFANKGGFASLGGDSKPGTFGSGASLSMGTESSFSASKTDASSQGNGFSGFKLESTFKRDPAADKDEPAGSGGGSLFGSAFGSALGGGPQIKEEEMGGSAAEPPKPQASLFATPAPKPTAAEQALFTSKSGPVGGGMFGGSVSSTPAAPPPTDGGSLFGGSKPASTSLFGGPKPADAASAGVFGKPSTTTPTSTGATGSSLFGQPSGATGSSLFGQPSGTTRSSVFGQPSSTTGSSVFGRKTEAPTTPAEAPLPPDFTKPTPAQVDDAPLPPDFTSPAPAPEAPLPPDFASKPKKDAAPAPPTDAALPADDEEEDGFSEGSGVDVAKELGQSASNVDVAALAPVASSGGAPPPSSNLFGESGRGRVPTPSQSSAPAAALGQSVQSFASRQDSLRPESALGSQLGRRSPLPQQPSHPPSLSGSRLGSSILSASMRQPGVDPFTQSHRQSIASREAEERQLLADQDDGTQELLASELVPTLTLDEFVAHTDVVTAANETISSQVEAVYRDINAMIDTLGINARSLQCFIKGHMDGAGKPGQRTLDDLEAPEEWTLGDLPALAGMLHHDLTNDLNNGRVKDIGGKLDACKNLTRDLGRLRARKAELERIVAARVDPEQAGTTRSFPLTPEQSAQQNDLRREYARFTKNLAEAEEALTLLKTRIASINGARSGGPGATTMPTVDAVIRTINKMTSIAEKRSGDVDVLENQMRKMRLNSVARSREGTPSVGMTPQKRASIGPASSPLTPDASSTLRRNLRDSFAVSVSGAASPAAARKPQGLSRYTPEQKAQLLQRLNRRKDVLRKLEVHVVKEGVKTWVVDEPTMK